MSLPTLERMIVLARWFVGELNPAATVVAVPSSLAWLGGMICQEAKKELMVVDSTARLQVFAIQCHQGLPQARPRIYICAGTVADKHGVAAKLREFGFLDIVGMMHRPLD